jgi:transketolase
MVMTAAIQTLGYADLERLMALQLGDEKHNRSATSTLDAIWVLYDRVLRVDPLATGDPDRDRFLLSKGHGPMAYYAVLAAKGFIDPQSLPTFGRYQSPLGHHPDRNRVTGIEISSGSLGHGLGIAVGTALGLRARRSPARVFCLVGDAELEEGSNHEAIAYAGRFGLEGLTCVVVDNRSSSLGWPGGIASRFAMEGWSTATVDGRDHKALERAFAADHARRPHAVVAVVEQGS